MDVSSIIAEIDSQIAKLQMARDIIAGPPAAAPKTGAKRGRPKGSKNAPAKAASSSYSKVTANSPAKAAGKTKRKLSPEGRKAIADAMKKRWAERKKAAAK